MKTAVISDIHSNLEALETVLKKIKEISVDSVYCLGDIVGYNANPNECVEIIRKENIPCVMGNHDRVACGIEEPFFFNPLAKEAALWTRGVLSDENRTFLRTLPQTLNIDVGKLCVHGSPRDEDEYILNNATADNCLLYLEEHYPEVRICLFGHTHRKSVYTDEYISLDKDRPEISLKDDQLYLINPGSVGQPRDRDRRASFIIMDESKKVVSYYLEKYDIKQTAEKIRKEDLPVYLAERLYEGR